MGCLFVGCVFVGCVFVGCVVVVYAELLAGEFGYTIGTLPFVFVSLSFFHISFSFPLLFFFLSCLLGMYVACLILFKIAVFVLFFTRGVFVCVCVC